MSDDHNCRCASPSPVEMTEETFDRSDKPTAAERSHFCDRCGGTIEHDDDGPYALPEEFDDDGTQDFTEGDVIT